MSIVLPPIRRKVLADALVARLRELDDVTVYPDGEVRNADGTTTAPVLDGLSKRVGPYVVLFASAGTPVIDGEADLAGEHDDLRQTHVLHLVAGFKDDCLQLADRVHALLYRWQPVAAGPLAGLAFGRMVPPPGYDPGAPRLTETDPPRFWLPNQWRLDTTT